MLLTLRLEYVIINLRNVNKQTKPPPSTSRWGLLVLFYQLCFFNQNSKSFNRIPTINGASTNSTKPVNKSGTSFHRGDFYITGNSSVFQGIYFFLCQVAALAHQSELSLHGPVKSQRIINGHKKSTRDYRKCFSADKKFLVGVGQDAAALQQA